MSTARQKLIEEVLELASNTKQEKIKKKLKKLLSDFRVQQRPGVHKGRDITARDILLDGLAEILIQEDVDQAQKVKDEIALFRMQLKVPKFMAQEQEANQKSLNGKNAAKKVRLSSIFNDKTSEYRSTKMFRASAKEIFEKTLNPELAKSEPVAGGPKKKNRSRGKCPKCHSMGVVLAHSNSGDEYFSCIYCGFQIYKKTAGSDVDLPLAAELLSRAFDGKDHE